MKLYHYKNDLCNACGSNIKALRESKKLSQEQLAANLQLLGLNINQKAISRIETGERIIPDYELLYFAKVFNIKLSDLFSSAEI